MDLQQTICAMPDFHELCDFDEEGALEHGVVGVENILGDARTGNHAIREVGAEELGVDVLEDGKHVACEVKLELILDPRVATL